MAQLPPHFGLNFTPTIHRHIPQNINPTKVHLPEPFIVVVTGAGKGLGYHISLAFAKAGVSGISISSRTQSDLNLLEEEIGKVAKDKGVEIEVLKSVCDVQNESSVKALEEEVRKKWKRVDVVIANAGIISKYIEKEGEGESNLPVGIVEDEDWSRVLDINVNGVWRISKPSIVHGISCRRVHFVRFEVPSKQPVQSSIYWIGKLTITNRQSIHTPLDPDKRRPPDSNLQHKSSRPFNRQRPLPHRLQRF
jgi:NAD(P)-dependent dehydrogenase (short-subunit alcohol dehydrogenase family)